MSVAAQHSHGYTGLRYLDLENDHNRIFGVNFSNPGQPPLIGTAVFNEKSDFSGIGPILGLDGQYYLGYGFSLAGHFDGAIVVGNLSANTNVV